MQHRSSASPRLELFARQNRCNLNGPEFALWQAIRRPRLGVTFRRQVVIGDRYIVDFLAPSAKLVVEVDGKLAHSRRRASDARRDEWLRAQGYRVLRLDAQLIVKRTAVAVARIRAALERPP